MWSGTACWQSYSDACLLAINQWPLILHVVLQQHGISDSLHLPGGAAQHGASEATELASRESSTDSAVGLLAGKTTSDAEPNDSAQIPAKLTGFRRITAEVSGV